jgi:uroporphyrinogen decarboxylase
VQGDAVGLDWTVDLSKARALIGDRVALQGNLDPAALLAGAQAARSGVERVLAAYGCGSGHVFNLGHGISQFTAPEAVAALVDSVRELSPAYH